jgi:hypothetical protein
MVTGRSSAAQVRDTEIQQQALGPGNLPFGIEPQVARGLVDRQAADAAQPHAFSSNARLKQQGARNDAELGRHLTRQRQFNAAIADLSQQGEHIVGVDLEIGFANVEDIPLSTRIGRE